MPVTMSAALTPIYAAQINQSRRSPWIAGGGAVCLVGFGQRFVRDNRLDPRILIAATAVASSWRTLPSRPRASAHSRRWAFDLRGGRKRASKPTGSQRARRRPCAGDNSDVREHVVIVVIPLARRTAGRGVLEDQRHVRALAARNPRGVNYPG